MTKEFSNLLAWGIIHCNVITSNIIKKNNLQLLNKDWLLLQKLFWIKPCVHFIFRTTAWILAPNPISKRHAESFSSYNKLLKIKMNGPIDNLTDKMMDKKRDLDVSSKKPALSVGNLVPQTKYKSKNVGRHGWSTLKNQSPQKRKVDQTIKAFCWKYFFGHITFAYSSTRSSEYYQIFF